MSKEYVQTTIEIIKCFEEEEFDEVYKLIEESDYGTEWGDEGSISRKSFDTLLGGEERFIKLYGSMPYGTNEELEKYLQEKGIPFKRWSAAGLDYATELVVFDGVRSHTVGTSETEEPMVPMSVLRAIIDILETPEEEDPYADMRALVYANENWIPTDINMFHRYGMESTVAFSPNAQGNGVIDVEAEETTPQLENPDGEN